MYYVYILHLAGDTLYKGMTSNLKRRIVEHHLGKVKSTKRYKDVLQLIYYEGYALKSDAERRERFLKTTEGKRLLKQQIRDVLIKGGSPSHSTGRGVG